MVNRENVAQQASITSSLLLQTSTPNVCDKIADTRFSVNTRCGCKHVPRGVLGEC